MNKGNREQTKFLLAFHYYYCYTLHQPFQKLPNFLFDLKKVKHPTPMLIYNTIQQHQYYCSLTSRKFQLKYRLNKDYKWVAIRIIILSFNLSSLTFLKKSYAFSITNIKNIPITTGHLYPFTMLSIFCFQIKHFKSLTYLSSP